MFVSIRPRDLKMLGRRLATDGEPVLIKARSTSAEIAELLFERSHKDMIRLAVAMQGDRAEAEDIVMDAFVKTFAKWGALRDVSKALFYLRRTVINLSRSRLRTRSLQTKLVGKIGRDVSRSEPPATEHRAAEELHSALATLSWRQRACVLLKYFEGLQVEEIARILDCSPGTVKTHLSRARKHIALTLEQTEAGGRDALR